MKDYCYHCGQEVSLNSEYYTVSIKDRVKNRWMKIGVACDNCIDVKNLPCRIKSLHKKDD